jgi:hypothetical protein
MYIVCMFGMYGNISVSPISIHNMCKIMVSMYGEWGESMPRFSFTFAVLEI